ncbi:MAG: hypothetical protein PUB67_02540 [Clostridiales bacterium]|nr:hypothetical protein [Clostridiales bacterium]
MKKKITAFFLCLLMVLGAIPIQVLADTIVPFNPSEEPLIIKPYYPDFNNSLGYNAPASGNGEKILEAMLNQIKDAEDPTSTNKPESFFDDTLTPYGTQKGEAFTMLEKLELFEYVSLGNNLKDARIMDDMSVDIKTSFVPTKDQTISSGLPGLRFARGVAFDPSGCGRRNYVALMGYRDTPNSTTTGSIYIYIINADTRTVECQTTMMTNSSKLRKFINEVTMVDSSNFFQITAGDYNGDGRDNLVVGCGCINGSASIYQFGLANVSYDTSAKKATVTNMYEGTEGKFLHSEFIKKKMGNSSDLANQLCMSLDTDDLNGDGIDDLVVLSCTGDITSEYVSKVQNKTCIPQLTVAYGQKGIKNISSTTAIDRQSIVQNIKSKDITMACPDVTIGDMDGDGRKEILVAGYKNETKANDVLIVPDDSTGSITYAFFETTGKGTLKRVGDIKEIEKSNVCPIAKDDSLRERETYFQQLCIESVALDGVNTQEYVFVNGYFYYLNDSGNLISISGNGEAECSGSFYQNLFHYLPGKINNVDVDEVFILTSSVGNYFGSNSGREGVAVIVGFKKHSDANKESSYNFRQAIVWGDDNTKGENKETNIIGVDSQAPMEKIGSSYYGFVSGSCGNIGTVLVGVDVGSDTVVAKYSGKACTYTDPTPVAFLQAAPYFSELGAGNSSTQYSYSEGYRVTNGNSTETSYNIGLTVEAEAGPVKTSMDIGAAFEVIEEFAESLEKTYTTTFEANDQNQIILRQTLMYYYFYDVQVYDSKTGKYEFKPCSLVVSAPQYPVLTSLSIEQYNAFARAYNKKIDEFDNTGNKKVDKAHKMQVISDALIAKYYLNNEGNPFAYAKDSSNYKYNNNRFGGWDFCKSTNGSTDNWMKLSYAGGTQQQAYTVTLDKEKTKSVSEGCYMNTAIMGGGGIGPFSVYAGVSAGFERLKGHSFSTASITSTETSGSVQNLNNEQTSYRFNWKLIGWKTDDLFEGIPFVGYAVKDQVAPPQPVTDLKASFSSENGGRVTLTWTSPTILTGRKAINYFYVNCDKESSYVAATSNKGAGVEHSVTIDVSNYSDRSGATFTVSSYNEAGNAASMPSNEVYVMFVLTDHEVIRLINEARNDLQTKIDDLKAQLNSGNNVSVESFNNLIEAYKEADKLINSRIDDLVLVQNALEDKMSAADVLLEEAINKVESELLTAIDELGKSNEEALSKAITDLTDAYKNADALLKSDIDSLSSKHDSLEQAVKNADKTLQDAIDKVNEDLTKAIENLGKAGDEALEKAVKELTNAYNSADALINSDISSLAGKQADLEKTVSEADKALQQAIDEMDKKLTDAIEKLGNSSDNNLQQAITNLTAVRENADALLKADIKSVSDKLTSLEQNVNKADEAINASIKKVKDDLDATKLVIEALSKKIEEMESSHKEDIKNVTANMEEGHKKDIDELNAELEIFKNQVSKNNSVNGSLIKELADANDNQQSSLDTNRVLSIVGLGIGSVSLFGNIALLMLIFRKKSALAL